MAVVVTMCKLLLALGVGFYLFRSGVFSKEINAKLSTMIARITNPALLIYSVSTVAGADVKAVLRLFLGGCVFYLLLIGFSWLYVRIFRVRVGLRGTYMCMLIFANYGFMGWPVVSSLFGTSAIFYSAIFNMPFNFIIYTLGDYLIRRDAAVESGTLDESTFSLKKFFTPGVIASIAALVIFFAGIKLPAEFYTCADFIGGITIPLSMIIIGSSLASASLADIKSEKSLLPLLLARFIIIPVFLWLIMPFITSDPTIIKIAVISIAMPVGTLTSMLCAPYPTQGRASSLCVVASTLCSIITIPIWILIVGA